MTQTISYQTLKHYDDFELRLYKTAALASSTAPQTFPEIGHSFRPLARYIRGHNRTRQEIPMTAPVLVTPAAPGDSVYLLQFFLPSVWSIDTAPLPSPAPNGQDDVTLLALPARKVAALRYKGVWSQDVFALKAQQLRQAVANANLVPAGEPVQARYNSPFWPPFFMRRNEVWLEIV